MGAHGRGRRTLEGRETRDPSHPRPPRTTTSSLPYVPRHTPRPDVPSRLCLLLEPEGGGPLSLGDSDDSSLPCDTFTLRSFCVDRSCLLPLTTFFVDTHSVGRSP